MKKNNYILQYKDTEPKSGGASFTLKNRVIRLIWNFCWFAFASWTPPAMYAWRRLLLKIFGAHMGPRTDVRGSARVWYPPLLSMEAGALLAERVICYNQAHILIQNEALISQGAHLCAGTHDVDDLNFQLLAKPIIIESHAWVAAEAFVGPGVTIKRYAVLGARAVTFSNLEINTIYIGNPAKSIRQRKISQN